MSNTTNGNATANHERLIKRSTVIERRLTGNIFCTVAIDKDDKIIGCGCKKLYDPSASGFISLFSETYTILATHNNKSGSFKTLTPHDSDELMPYYAFTPYTSYIRKSFDAKVIDFERPVIGILSYSGQVFMEGYCEAGEGEASSWKDIDDLVVFNEGVLGVTKDGRIKLCGAGAQPYLEMTLWTNVARVKKIHTDYVGLASEGFVGLKKDGTLLYCGRDKAFAKHIESFENVVSFDGLAYQGQMRCFYAVMSDGSLHYYHPANELIQKEDIIHHQKNYIAVKYLPSGPHFIKNDGSLKTFPNEVKYSEELIDCFLILTGRKYSVVNAAIKTAANHPLAEQVTDWKLFDDPDEVLRRYEGVESGSFMQNKKCLYCGGDLKGFLQKKCVSCGKKSSY